MIPSMYAVFYEYSNACSIYTALWIAAPWLSCSPGKACVSVQVGRGGRSEKIRTYNFKGNRMSDHRLKQNYDLNRVLEGDLEDCVQSMVLLDQQEQLQSLAET